MNVFKNRVLDVFVGISDTLIIRQETLMISEISRVGKRGVVVIPAGLRRRFNVSEGSYVVVEEKPDGILLRPATVVPTEMYSPERKAEFLLSSAVDQADYSAAVKEVKALGLDPARIKHHRPVRRRV